MKIKCALHIELTIMRSRSDPDILVKVLEATRLGATKAEVLARLPSLSSSQLRRIGAELSDKRYWRPDPNDKNRYVTTHRGYEYLNRLRKGTVSTKRISS
jgi:predicted transcriptional regulator